jgi:hypothetical protein
VEEFLGVDIKVIVFFALAKEFLFELIFALGQVL